MVGLSGDGRAHMILNVAGLIHLPHTASFFNFQRLIIDIDGKKPNDKPSTYFFTNFISPKQVSLYCAQDV